MKVKVVSSLLLALMLVGCSSVDVTKTAKGFYEQTDPNEVEILKTRPTRSFQELGTITAAGFPPTQTAVMHNEIRKKAAALGAHAAILTEEGISGGEKWSTGVAIIYKK